MAEGNVQDDFINFEIDIYPISYPKKYKIATLDIFRSLEQSSDT